MPADTRMNALAKRGIIGQDAVICLATIDRVLRQDNMKTWDQISDKLNHLSTTAARDALVVAIFGNDAARAALALHAEAWRTPGHASTRT